MRIPSPRPDYDAIATMSNVHIVASNATTTGTAMFPVDFDPVRGEFMMLSVTSDSVADAAFLDKRFGGDRTSATRLDWREVPVTAHAPRTALLFHTAFCCSTLLARALQVPPQVIALREPQALTQLANVALRHPREQIKGPMRAALQLLSRPWTPDGCCLIKPTNQANNLLPDILSLTSGKAILLYSSLSDFVVSCCEKLPEADTRVRWMAQHLLKDTNLQRALGVPWDLHFHFIEACVLTWYAQIERYADALSVDTDDRLRSLDMQAMLADPLGIVRACADWLELGIDAAALRDRVAMEFERNAKHPDTAFNAAARAAEKAQTMAQYSDLLDNALTWAREAILPWAQVPVDWKPLMTASVGKIAAH